MSPVLALAPSLPMPPMGGGGILGPLAAGLWALPIAAAIYLICTVGKVFSPECSWKDDDQIGLKVIVSALILVGTGLFAAGLQGFLHLITTFKNFGPTLKVVLPDLLVGAVVLGGAIMFAVPQTNHETQPKVLRMTAGAIALTGAVATVLALDNFLATLFAWPDYYSVAGALTSLVTAVAVLGGSGYFFAKFVGIAVPDLPMPAGVAAVGQAVGQAAYQQQAQAQAYQQPVAQQPAPQAAAYQAPQAQAPQAQAPQAGYQVPQPQAGAGYQAPPQPGAGYQAPQAPQAPSGPPRPQGGYRPPGQ